MTSEPKHISWEKWKPFREVKFTLVNRIITKIYIKSLNNAGIAPKIQLIDFLQIIEAKKKGRRIQVKIHAPSSEFNPQAEYNQTKQLAAIKINQNAKKFIHNLRLTRKIINFHILYLSYIHSNISESIFEDVPFFNTAEVNPSLTVNKKIHIPTPTSDIRSSFTMSKTMPALTNAQTKPERLEVIEKNGSIKFSNHKVTYAEVYNELRDIYHNDNEYFSSAMDILASYVKGQKIIYMEAESHCQGRLNFLMFPAIFSSATASVMAAGLEGIPWGATLISSINAGISFLLAIISYLKLDAQSEAHKTSAHQYDKLQSICEFSSGSILLFTDMQKFDEEKEESEFFKKLKGTVAALETKIKEIKETNQFIVPRIIRHRYKIAYNINIFSVIKKISGLKKHYVTFIRDRINQIKMYKIEHNHLLNTEYTTKSPEIIKLKQLIDQEYYEKSYGFEKYQLLKSSFGIIDQLLADEMEFAEKVRQRWCCAWCCCYTKLPRPEMKNTLTHLITDPFSSLDNRTHIQYMNHLKKMHQKYDTSGNIFSYSPKGKKSKKKILSLHGCNKLNREEEELQTLLSGLDNPGAYENYQDYACCCQPRCLIIGLIITITIACTIGTIVAILT